MLKKITVACFILGVVAGQAMAASTYYVGHKAGEKGCSVVEVKPDGKKLTQVGNGHKTKAEAETAMKTAAECK